MAIRRALLGAAALVLAVLAVLVPVGVVRAVTTMPGTTAPDATAPDDAEAETDRTAEAPEHVEIVVFHGDGCPHCHRLLDFLDGLEADRDGVTVTTYEVWYDDENERRFADTLAALGEEPRAVPTTVIDERVIVGHSPAIERRIEGIVDDLLGGRAPADDEALTIDVPLVGEVDVGSRSLVGATALIALVDGVNPCSLWVLSMLLALVIHSGSRARVAIVGALFLLITSLLYGLYMLGAYSALSIVGRRAGIRIAVAVVAGAFGAMHVKEHFTARGPSVTIGSEHKPGLFRRMRRLADLDRSLPATLGGTAVLAVGVSLLETPCTAGLPLLWTDLLAERDVPVSGAAVLFALYLAIFLVDELVIFGAAVATMRATKLQEHHGRALQLIGGMLMLTLAVAMLAAPHLLESIAGTIVVFGVAASATAAVMGIEAWGRRGRPRDERPTAST